MAAEKQRDGDDGETTVLIVEDEPDVADLYRGALVDEGYEVVVERTAAAGTAALDGDVDVALLDRRLQDGVGGDVLEAWRADGAELPVAMVTAVDPDFDIAEFGFDLYVLKPLSGDRIVRTVDRLLDRRGYSSALREAAALREKCAALRRSRGEASLAGDERYQALLDRIDELDAEIERLEESFAPGDYRPAYRALGDDSDRQA